MSQARTILIAAGEEITRGNIASLLISLGYNVLQAIDGTSAIKVVQEHHVDMAIFDHAMTPMGGFDFARYVLGANLQINMVLMVDEGTSDLLNVGGSLKISHFLNKPINPKRLTDLVQRTLKPVPDDIIDPLHYAVKTKNHTPEDLMDYAIKLATRNAEIGHGGPYAAVVADPDGRIVGEGVNLSSSRFDPVAHAEVMAIRQATTRLQQPHLEGCSIFCTSEPTMIGQALINSVVLSNIYLGLTHEDIRALRADEPDMAHHGPQKPAAKIIRLGYDDAKSMFQAWQHGQAQKKSKK
jgi:guanine deaminase